MTLDSFDALVSNLTQYIETGLFSPDALPWAFSLTDLRVISEMVGHSSQFVHYLIRRQKINEIKGEQNQAFEEQHPQGYLDADCALLDLSGHARASFVETIQSQRQRTLMDSGFHDFSAPIEAAGTGITCMFARREHALELHERLVNHCLHKIGDHSSILWIGFGFLVDAPRQLNSYLVFDSNQGIEEDAGT